MVRGIRWTVPVLIALSLLGLVGMSACSFGVRAAEQSLDAAATDARAESCYALQRMVEGAAHVHEIEKGAFPTDIVSLVPSYIPEPPVCPDGGTYSFELVDGVPICSCSVHGHYSANE